MGLLTASEYATAGVRLEQLRRGWRELQPSEALRSQAETFLMTYALKAADALQLAAAWTWCSGYPQNYVFISADTQLLEAVRQVGFQIVAV
jgi:predicted nucleic acid-binding protein